MYLKTCLDYLSQLTQSRLSTYFNKSEGTESLPHLNPPAEDDLSPFAQFCRHYQFSSEELTLITIALAPHLHPGFFDHIVQQYLPQGGEFPLFGGARSNAHRGMLPTGETALFLLAGTDFDHRLAMLPLFDSEHFLYKHKILFLESVNSNEPPLSGRLVLEPEFIEVFTTGKISTPKLSFNFPAQHLSTELTWDDLILDEYTRDQIRELETWIRHNDTLRFELGMHKKIKPGYRAVFYGPPGTGKTLTATLLGKYTGRDVFRVDLSTVVSKYIGETEKNLSSLFDKAENKNWILFFDEADALFGKRTSTSSAHDRYANQEVSYLLQRIESFPGMVILATNARGNIDEAFTRRFQALVYFPLPKPSERLLLWQKAFPEKISLADDVNLEEIAQKFDLTGSNIINIVHFCCLEALENKTTVISKDQILAGIRRELLKEGKTM